MRQLIINADDFGLSPGVSQGIALAAKSGVVTSTTLMGNMQDLAQHLSYLQGIPVGLGIHLVLSAGRPRASSGVDSLTDERGYFRRDYRQAIKLADPTQVKKELQAQIEHVLNLGVKPTHLDSHHHVHMAPQLTKVAVELAHRYGIPAIRRATLRDVMREQGLGVASLALPMVTHSSYIINKSGLKHPNRLIAFRGTNLTMLSESWTGVCEMFCYPGYVDEELRLKSSLLEAREQELQSLTSVALREGLSQAGIQLVSYAVFS